MEGLCVAKHLAGCAGNCITCKSIDSFVLCKSAPVGACAEQNSTCNRSWKGRCFSASAKQLLESQGAALGGKLDSERYISCPIRVSIHPSRCSSVRLPIPPSICPSAHPCVCLSIHLSIHPPTCPSLHLSIQLSIHRSVCPSIHPSVHARVHLYLHLSKRCSLFQITSWYVCILP